MSAQSYGAESRKQVKSGKRLVPGLFERTLADGSSVFEFRGRLGGKVTRHTLEARTKTDAIAELRRLQVDFERGEHGRSPALALTVADLAQDWLAHLQARTEHRDPRQRRSKRTVAHYRQQLNSHIIPVLGTRDAGELTVADVRRLVDHLAGKRKSPSTITGALNILSGLLRFGIKNGQVERNPVRDLDRDDRPGSARLTEPRYLSAAQLELLFSKMTDTFRPAAIVCSYTGLRVSEALGLRWADVDLAAATVHVNAQLGPDGKLAPVKTTASAAPVALLPAVVRELRAHHVRQRARGFQLVRPDALVFTTARGKPQSRRNALRAVHAAGDAAGLNPNGREKIGTHDLRHSFVANALAAGVTLPEAAELARHADARVTAIVYAGVTDADREKVVGKLNAVGFGA